MILTVFYGSLAFIALYATWRDRDLVWLGWALVGGWAVSNALFFLTPLSWRPGPYSVIELLVLYAAALAWMVDKRARWQLLILAGVNVLSITANVAFSATYSPNARQIYVWELATNLCFAAECLIATWVGIADGYRSGRFGRLSRDSERHMAPDAARRERR